MGQPFSYIVIGRSGAKLTLYPLYNGITYPLEINVLYLQADEVCIHQHLNYLCV